MNVDQTRLNTEYQEILNAVFSGEISLRDKYLNQKAVIKHHCKVCIKNFYSRPLLLVNKQQPHECHFAAVESLKGKKKDPKPKKTAGTKKGDSTPNKVTEAMKLEMIQLYKEGDTIKSISRRFLVTPPTVKRHIQQKRVE